MKFAADTGALLSLACSRFWKILAQEHTFILTPAVVEELRQFAQYDDFLGIKAQELLQLKWKIFAPAHVLALNLETAEREVFSIAKEQGLAVLTDDLQAIRVGYEKAKITAKPSFYLLLILYQKKKISKEELVEDIKILLNRRNWLSGALGTYALKLIEEL